MSGEAIAKTEALKAKEGTVNLSFIMTTSGFGLAHSNYVRIFSIKVLPKSIIGNPNISL
jgi:hypothetical protein